MTTDRLRGILDLVQQSLDEVELTGDELARRAYLSRFHFDRLVSAALGEAPGAFRRRLLLERAAHRLAATSDAVIDVALDAGYGSPEAFARAFGRAFGVPPSVYRCRPAVRHEIPAASGVHFHPPGALRLPAATKGVTMDVAVRMLDHHLQLTGQILEHLDDRSEEFLDRPIELSVEGIDSDPTARRLAARLVGQLEMWLAALDGRTEAPVEPAPALPRLHERFEAAAPRFRRLVVEALDDGRADETFVDATCEPPQTFSYAGLLAHVLTFSAVRRTLVIGALDSDGDDALGSGDPMEFVGGSGADASSIRRNWDS